MKETADKKQKRTRRCPVVVQMLQPAVDELQSVDLFTTDSVAEARNWLELHGCADADYRIVTVRSRVNVQVQTTRKLVKA
jgi:hypothetical protein